MLRILPREITEEEPRVDSTNPTLTDIYIYKRYIARQEREGSVLLRIGILSCIFL